jgi:hypothetical protein
MSMFVLPKWPNFNNITRHMKMYQAFHALTHLVTRQSVTDQVHNQQCLCSFYLSGLISTTSLFTWRCTKHSMLWHIWLLASRLPTRFSRRSLLLLNGQFTFDWSTLIVIFTIHPRQHLLWNLPSLRCENFLRTLPPRWLISPKLGVWFELSWTWYCSWRTTSFRISRLICDARFRVKRLCNTFFFTSL